jgi:hypothetical protein
MQFVAHVGGYRQSLRVASFEQLYRQRILSVPFGSLTKSELEYRLFACMIDSGLLGKSATADAISRRLLVTPTKARGLLYQHELRSFSEADAAETSARLAAAIRVVGFDGDRLTLAVESRFLRETLQSRLREADVFVDYGRNRELLSVDLYRFVQVAADVFPEAPYGEVVERLSAEKDWEKGSLGVQLRERLARSAKTGSDALRTADTLADVFAKLQGG